MKMAQGAVSATAWNLLSRSRRFSVAVRRSATAAAVRWVTAGVFLSAMRVRELLVRTGDAVSAQPEGERELYPIPEGRKRAKLIRLGSGAGARGQWVGDVRQQAAFDHGTGILFDQRLGDLFS